MMTAKGERWFCMRCAKSTTDLSDISGGWDESCTINAIMLNTGADRPTREQQTAWSEANNLSLVEFKSRINEMRDKMRNGITEDINPEMLALAEQQAVGHGLRYPVIHQDLTAASASPKQDKAVYKERFLFYKNALKNPKNHNAIAMDLAFHKSLIAPVAEVKTK